MTRSRRLRNIIIALAYNNNNKSMGDGGVCRLGAIWERQSPHSSCFRSARPPPLPTHPSYTIIILYIILHNTIYNIIIIIITCVQLYSDRNFSFSVKTSPSSVVILFLFLILSHAYLLYLNTSSSRIFFFRSNPFLEAKLLFFLL